MSRKVVLFTLLAVLLVSSIVSAAGTLTIISWPSYRSPELIKNFEQKFAAKVNFIEVGSYDDMFKNLDKADMVIMGELVMPQLIAENKVQPLNKSLIPNIKNADPMFLNMSFDQGNKYTLPYHYLLIGLAYNPKKVTASEATLKNYFEPAAKLKGRIVTNPEPRYNIGFALKYIGKSFNSLKKEDLDLVKILLQNFKTTATPGSDSLNRGIYDPLSDVISGKADLTISYIESQISMKAMGLGANWDKDVRFILPKEGAFIGSDIMAITKNAKNATLAHQFINFMYDPQNAAKSVAYLGYPFPVKGVDKLLDSTIAKQIYVPIDQLKKCESALPLSGSNVGIHERIWNEVFKK